MRAFLLTVVLGGVAGLLAARADDPPKKLTPDERKELEVRWRELTITGLGALRASKYADAQKPLEDALETAQRLYPKAEFPDGHEKLAMSLNNLAGLRGVQQRLSEAESLFKNALDMNTRLFTGDHPEVARSLNNLAGLERQQGKLVAAEPLLKDALRMTRRLQQGDHADVVRAMNNLAILYRDQGRLAEAEPLLKEALDMMKRLLEGDDHPDLATGLSNLGTLYRDQGKLAEAEPRFKEALDMRTRLFTGDHPAIATSLRNMGMLYELQDKLTNAKSMYNKCLDMTGNLFKQDHPFVAIILTDTARVCLAEGNLADAEPLLKRALDVNRRLFTGDHPDIARSLNNLAILHRRNGKLAEAELLLKDALDMRRRLFTDDHPDTAISLFNLAALYWRKGELADAETLSREALIMSRRRTIALARQTTEGEALTQSASLPLYRDGFISISLHPKSNTNMVYQQVWASKGTITRVYEQRQQEARAAASNPKTASLLAGLTDARRRRAELLLAPPTKDLKTREKREDDLRGLDSRIAELDTTIRPLLPTIARTEKLAESTPANLQKALRSDAAVIDFLRYTRFESDPKKPGKDGHKWTEQYVAFVLTNDKMAWIDLGPAERIEKAVMLWREAITTVPYTVPADIPARVRELAWDPVRKLLPAGTKVVYLCPDAELTKVPWVALPGDKPGTVLLEDFAIATIPYGQFLLDSLWPQEKREKPPVGFLAVGGVAFGTEPDSPGFWAATGGLVATRFRDVPSDPKKPINWTDLPGAKAEVEQITQRAANHMLATRVLTGPAASTDAVLAALPNARYAHLATHGFFADAQFRSVLQLDPKEYELARWGERIGRAANSPLVLSGLVLAGANLPATRGRGIVTGESLIDRDLSGLELAVLSACETGLGDVAGGEGVYGLQRAFHSAGTRNVVASLWKIPDEATAALMGEFYRRLWDEKNPLPPIEALRQAQLAVMRADPKDFRAMALRSVGKGDVKDPNIPVVGPPMAGGKTNPPVYWAAFTLSGPGTLTT